MGTQDRSPTYSSAWGGWIVFAAAVMFTVGAIDIIQGIVALTKDEVFLIAESGLLVTTDWTTWGWSLIIWGIVLIVAAAALFSLKGWGRWLAFTVVLLNSILQIAWFPAYPLWSLIALALDVVVLFALAARWQEARMDLTDR